MKIKPLFDKVVLKPTEIEEISQGGFILTSAAREKPQFSEVVAVGPGGIIDGNDVDMIVKVGDKVVVAKHYGNEFKIDGQVYTIVRQSDILAILE